MKLLAQQFQGYLTKSFRDDVGGGRRRRTSTIALTENAFIRLKIQDTGRLEREVPISPHLDMRETKFRQLVYLRGQTFQRQQRRQRQMGPDVIITRWRKPNRKQ